MSNERNKQNKTKQNKTKQKSGENAKARESESSFFCWPRNHRQHIHTLARTNRFHLKCHFAPLSTPKMSNNWIMLCLTISFAFMLCTRSQFLFAWFLSLPFHFPIHRQALPLFSSHDKKSDSHERREMKTKSSLNWYQCMSMKNVPKKWQNWLCEMECHRENAKPQGKTNQGQQISRRADCLLFFFFIVMHHFTMAGSPRFNKPYAKTTSYGNMSIMRSRQRKNKKSSLPYLWCVIPLDTAANITEFTSSNI